ncbi:MAG: hypothetical protein JO151_06210, partial [Verrucomicrobia bacterium]|nr:hypothetical protein [Verrucomicrobiota bacterium]
MLHGIIFFVAVILIAIGLYLLLRTGFSLNGKPMRFDPTGENGAVKSKSWQIEGIAA